MQPEEEIQIAYFEWIDIAARRRPELEYAYHCPNEKGTRSRNEMIKLWRMGVRPGVPDVFIPVPRGGYHGLYIEFKAGKNKPSKSQEKYMDHLEKQGYACGVFHGWKAAADFTDGYLRGIIKQTGRENNEEKDQRENLHSGPIAGVCDDAALLRRPEARRSVKPAPRKKWRP